MSEIWDVMLLVTSLVRQENICFCLAGSMPMKAFCIERAERILVSLMSLRVLACEEDLIDQMYSAIC